MGAADGPQDGGVNVFLQHNLSHGGPYSWYQETIERPTAATLGFLNSFEYEASHDHEVSFPVPKTYEEGSVLIQSVLSPDPFALILWEKPDGLSDAISPATVRVTEWWPASARRTSST